MREETQYCLNCESYGAENATLRKEVEEQARLLGMSGSREAKLQAEIDRLRGTMEKVILSCNCDYDGEKWCDHKAVTKAAVEAGK